MNESNKMAFIASLNLMAVSFKQLADGCAALSSILSEEPVKEKEPAEETPSSPTMPTVSREELRAKLADLVNAGHKDLVHTLFANYGVTKLSEVKEADYASMFVDAEEIENGLS